jgi:hypothetical protein
MSKITHDFWLWGVTGEAGNVDSSGESELSSGF